MAMRAVALLPLVLAGCHADVLDPRGMVGRAEKTILIDSLAIMLAIVVPTVLATLGVAWWFRASNARARYLPDWAYSGRIEMIVWSIPLLTIILLGGVCWIGSHELDPGRPLSSGQRPVDIQGVSMNWKWLFIYPDARVASVNELVVPAGVPLHFSLTSSSVMTAFFVPQLGSMIYTMNGMTSQLFLHADMPGTFRGLASHFSGDGFSDMHFNVRAVPADQYSAWIATARGAGPSLDRATYASLVRPGVSPTAFTYRDVEPGLFEQIVTQALPPGPGPANKPATGTASGAEQ